MVFVFCVTVFCVSRFGAKQQHLSGLWRTVFPYSFGSPVCGSPSLGGTCNLNMEEELRELKELIAQLKADNERLRQERALAFPGPSVASSNMSDAELVTPHPVGVGASQAERFVFVPRDHKCPKFNGKSGIGINEWIEEAQACIRARHLSVSGQAFFLFDHLEGETREEIRYPSDIEQDVSCVAYGFWLPSVPHSITGRLFLQEAVGRGGFVSFPLL